MGNARIERALETELTKLVLDIVLIRKCKAELEEIEISEAKKTIAGFRETSCIMGAAAAQAQNVIDNWGDRLGNLLIDIAWEDCPR